MIHELKSSLLVIILSILFYSCQKEYSLEGKPIGGTAVFSFNGSPGSCANAVVTGNYPAGAALGATNVVTISVNVTTAGTYTVSTPVINGISFTGSGTFAATGAQTISLTGSGIPATAGIFSYVTGVNGCAFPITISSGGGGSGSSVFTYNGAPGSCTGTSAGIYATGTALTASNTVMVNVTVTTIGTYSISTPLVNGFSFSGSGSFTAIGAQSVTLTGAGTPAVTGIFNFTPTNNGCSFPITVTAGTPATDFLRCTIDGVAKTFNVGLLGKKITSDTFDITGFETSSVTSPAFGIRLTKSPAITVGTYNRLTLVNNSIFCIAGYSDGVSVTDWVSGLALQPVGFTINVTSYTTSPNRIVGNFSGTLYDNDGAGTAGKVITLGTFSVPYL